MNHSQQLGISRGKWMRRESGTHGDHCYGSNSI